MTMTMTNCGRHAQAWRIIFVFVLVILMDSSESFSTTSVTLPPPRTPRAFHATNFVTQLQARSTSPNDDDDNNDNNDNNDEDESEPPTSSVDRRTWLVQQATNLVAGAAVTNAPPALASSTTPLVVPTPPTTRDVYWPTGKVAFSLLPLAGTSTRRKTVVDTLVEHQMWTHDQIQGVVNVNVPVRQTVVRLSPEAGGGLWVHNPVAPTPELIADMRALEQEYGPVRHIVLGTVALEHKATFGAFASYFPTATVWIQPGQWSFPLQIPIEFYGLVQRGPRLRELPVPGKSVSAKQYEYFSRNGPAPEWLADFDYEVLGPFSFQSVGAFSETAFYHKPTRTLLVTDTVCSVTATPPPIIQEDPRALLFHARNSATEQIEDTPATRERGWRRMVQFGLVFFPSQIQVRTFGGALRDASQVPASLANLGDGAVPGGKLYPWTWASDDVDRPNFDAISQNGRLFCPPILTKLILDREPAATLAWVDRVVARFGDTRRIVPCHLNNNVAVSSMDEFDRAFDPLRSRPDSLQPQRALAEDLALLQTASDALTKVGVVGPSLVCDGEPARQVGKFNFQ